jgi:integral membrane protein
VTGLHPPVPPLEWFEAVGKLRTVDTFPVVNRGVLIRYRVMAYTTAVLLIILVFVAIPLQFAAGKPEAARVVGTIHGYLYLVYLGVALDLTRKLRVPLGWMLLVLLAGTVPFCAFVAERKLTKRYDRLEVEAPAVSAVASDDQTGR